jgi:hypothetical protein
MHDGIIVAFPAQRTTKAKSPLPCSATVVDFSRREKATQQTIAHNEQLRAKRKIAWNKADIRTRFWLAMLRFNDMTDLAQQAGLSEACAYANNALDQRNSVLTCFREAEYEQLMAPAPDLKSVQWKRTMLLRKCIPKLLADHVQSCIAEDEAFLRAHPARQPCRPKQ